MSICDCGGRRWEILSVDLGAGRAVRGGTWHSQPATLLTYRPLDHHVHQQDACLTLVCPPRCGKRLSSPSHIIHELLGLKHCLLYFMTYYYNKPLTIEPTSTCCVRLCHRQLNKSLTLVYLTTTNSWYSHVHPVQTALRSVYTLLYSLINPSKIFPNYKKLLTVFISTRSLKESTTYMGCSTKRLTLLFFHYLLLQQ